LAYFKNLNLDSSASKAALGFDLKGRLDFSNVVFTGHSRGGEGARAAAHFQQTAVGYGANLQDINVRGVFEFAATDNFGSFPFAATGIPWASVLASCDRDLYYYPNAQTFMRRVNGQESELTS